MKVARLSALRTGRVYPRKYSWYSFLLEAESTPGPYCDRKIMSMKNSNDTIRNRSRNLPVCSLVPQPLHHRMPQYTVNKTLNSKAPAYTSDHGYLRQCCTVFNLLWYHEKS